VWQDGFLQIGTSEKDLRRLSPSLDRRIRRELGQMMAVLRKERLEKKVSSSSSCGSQVISVGVKSEPATLNGLNVWEASKLGNMETTLAIIDSGAASPNDVELLDVKETAYKAEGRTPLYWACFGGHVELVRELLLRGGEDRDGAAYCAVTTREAANDQRDILFDPDTGVYSDFVDYIPGNARPQQGKKSDEALLIRALLVAAKSAKSTDAGRLVLRLPKKLYREPRKECIVCLVNSADTVALPCGHVACCWTCVRKIRKRSEGCPLCRAPMLAVERSTANL
jgi:Zinc finger, C3HC4 type (RING finger)